MNVEQRPHFETEPERESPQAHELVTLAELLERSDLDNEPTTKALLQLFVAEHPALSEVGVGFLGAEEETHTGGYFDVMSADDETLQPIIFIALGQAEKMKRLMETRRQSVKMSAELLGLEPEEMTPDLLNQFILLHELGHAKDFMKNYLPQHDDVSEAFDEWRLHYNANLGVLPVSGLDPAQLNEAIAANEDFSVALAQHPDINSLEELQRAQEIAYRQSPYESYADKVAADFLKKHTDLTSREK